jgi:hypothetical protein
MKIVLWVAGVGAVLLLAGFVVLAYFGPGRPVTVGPDDPPPGVDGDWAPDVLGVLVSADLDDGYMFPNAARRPNGWRLIGPAVLHLADGSQYAMPPDTPLWGSCFTLHGDPDRARPRHCVVHIGLEADGITIEWIKVIDESRSDKDGVPVVPETAVAIINFDRIDEDAGTLVGRGGDVYRLGSGWTWSDDFRPRSGHPVFTTFDFATGLVLRLEPMAFEG